MTRVRRLIAALAFEEIVRALTGVSPSCSIRFARDRRPIALAVSPEVTRDSVPAEQGCRLAIGGQVHPLDSPAAFVAAARRPPVPRTWSKSARCGAGAPAIVARFPTRGEAWRGAWMHPGGREDW